MSSGLPSHHLPPISPVPDPILVAQAANAQHDVEKKKKKKKKKEEKEKERDSQPELAIPHAINSPMTPNKFAALQHQQHAQHTASHHQNQIPPTPLANNLPALGSRPSSAAGVANAEFNRTATTSSPPRPSPGTVGADGTLQDLDELEYEEDVDELSQQHMPSPPVSRPSSIPTMTDRPASVGAGVGVHAGAGYVSPKKKGGANAYADFSDHSQEDSKTNHLTAALESDNHGGPSISIHIDEGLDGHGVHSPSATHVQPDHSSVEVDEMETTLPPLVRTKFYSYDELKKASRKKTIVLQVLAALCGLCSVVLLAVSASCYSTAFLYPFHVWGSLGGSILYLGFSAISYSTARALRHRMLRLGWVGGGFFLVWFMILFIMCVSRRGNNVKDSIITIWNDWGDSEREKWNNNIQNLIDTADAHLLRLAIVLFICFSFTLFYFLLCVHLWKVLKKFFKLLRYQTENKAESMRVQEKRKKEIEDWRKKMEENPEVEMEVRRSVESLRGTKYDPKKRTKTTAQKLKENKDGLHSVTDKKKKKKHSSEASGTPSIDLSTHSRNDSLVSPASQLSPNGYPSVAPTPSSVYPSAAPTPAYRQPAHSGLHGVHVVEGSTGQLALATTATPKKFMLPDIHSQPGQVSSVPPTPAFAAPPSSSSSSSSVANAAKEKEKKEKKKKKEKKSKASPINPEDMITVTREGVPGMIDNEDDGEESGPDLR